MLRALESPIRQIVENAGVEGSIVVAQVLESKSDSYDFDAQGETNVDMVAAGIIDPTKVSAPPPCRTLRRSPVCSRRSTRPLSTAPVRSRKSRAKSTRSSP